MAFSNVNNFALSSLSPIHIQGLKNEADTFVSLPPNKNISSIAHNLVAKLPKEYFAVGHKEKVNEISRALRNAETRLDSLIMIDGLQRLAIDYHFEEEVQEALNSQYGIIKAYNGGHVIDVYNGSDYDLFNVSLCFRLLRQEGFPVSSDVFNLFTDDEGKFRLQLGEDIRGMMSLYEAAQFGIHGEEILEEAKAFTRAQLCASMEHADVQNGLSRMVMATIEHPYHKSLPRFMTKQNIKSFGATNGAINGLIELAKLEFDMVRSLYLAELSQISTWWRDLGLSSELKFARDQLVKWYMWSVATLTDPRHSNQRIELTKPISLIYLMDDIFDVYGTLDELVLFTDAINKWDLNAMETLPNQMKLFYRAVYDTTNEISYKVLRKHGWDPSNSLRKAWTSLCNAFLVEAKWFASGYVPGAGEYLKNGIISSGVHVVFAHTFFLLGEGITKETVQLIDQTPSQVSSVAAILRLWDDLGNAKNENQEGYDGSYIECYMKDNRSCTLDGAREHVVDLISNEWKRLNADCISPNPFPKSFTKATLNFARMVSLMYNYDDKQRLPSLEKHINSIFYNETFPFVEDTWTEI